MPEDNWRKAAKAHVDPAFGSSTAKLAIDHIADNGNTAPINEVEEAAGTTGADGGVVVKILEEANIVSTDIYHGKKRVMAQSNRNLWKDYQDTADKLRRKRKT